MVILLDHQLDCATGIDVLKKVKEMHHNFSLDITWVLVSSTEDNHTIKK